MGLISTIAGNGNNGYNGDSILATLAELNYPNCVTVDTNDNIYICDVDNYRIRKVDSHSGNIYTILGNGVSIFSGDGGQASNATVKGLASICIDNYGNIYVGEFNRIRKINAFGFITTVAGNGIAGCSGDGGLATNAQIGGVTVCTDKTKNIFFADAGLGECRIGKIDSFGLISTVAGNDTGYIYNGDNIPATSANICPMGLGFDNLGNLFFSDAKSNRIRMIDNFSIIHDVVGNGISGFSGDGGNATNAELSLPSGINFDKCNNLYITDLNNARIRKVTFDTLCINKSLTPEMSTNNPPCSIYPNPAYSELHIDNLKSQTAYSVYNLTGIVEQAGTLNAGSNTVEVGYLQNGLYFFEATLEDGERIIRKFIKY